MEQFIWQYSVDNRNFAEESEAQGERSPSRSGCFTRWGRSLDTH
jgi:hypothetical protein